MMDDFILDMKWDAASANINKGARSGTTIQSLFSNSNQINSKMKFRILLNGVEGMLLLKQP